MESLRRKRHRICSKLLPDPLSDEFSERQRERNGLGRRRHWKLIQKPEKESRKKGDRKDDEGEKYVGTQFHSILPPNRKMRSISLALFAAAKGDNLDVGCGSLWKNVRLSVFPFSLLPLSLHSFRPSPSPLRCSPRSPCVPLARALFSRTIMVHRPAGIRFAEAQSKCKLIHYSFRSRC